MDGSERMGYRAYPLLIFLLLLLIMAPRMRAQTPSSSAPTAQTQSPPEENPQENEIRLAREAQARIRERRQRRVEQLKQDTYSHKYEVYGVGGYVRFRPGPFLQHDNESFWDIGITDYTGQRLGYTGDIRGYYGTAFTYPSQYNLFEPYLSEYSMMVGPQYRIIRNHHWADSAQLLFGASRGNFNADSALTPPGTAIGLWPNGWFFSLSAGVTFDYNLSPSLAARLMPGYFLTTYGGVMQVKNLGFTSGLVYRFGRR